MKIVSAPHRPPAVRDGKEARMSQTISIGVVGPRYWSFMARRMADCLQSIVEEGSFKKGSIPRNVLADAVRFFDLVLQELKGGPPSSGGIALRNPEATLRAYLLAVNTQERIHKQIPGDRSDELQRYWELLNVLHQSQGEGTDLNAEQIGTAEALMRFFRELKDAGEAEAYVARLGFPPRPHPLLASR